MRLRTRRAAADGPQIRPAMLTPHSGGTPDAKYRVREPFPLPVDFARRVVVQAFLSADCGPKRSDKCSKMGAGGVWPRPVGRVLAPRRHPRERVSRAGSHAGRLERGLRRGWRIGPIGLIAAAGVSCNEVAITIDARFGLEARRGEVGRVGCAHRLSGPSWGIGGHSPPYSRTGCAPRPAGRNR